MLFNASVAPIVLFNQAVGWIFGVLFFYQVVYTVVGLVRGEVRLPRARKNHRYAFFVAAHNEEAVIGNLVKSMLEQEYPSELFDVFVVADACTDNTAEEARKAGAIVYERYDLARKGKSWVLDYGFDRILNEYPGRYEAFIVFDADNVLSSGYLAEMNRAFDMGFLAVTSYRNSKNFDSSWISMSYAINFLREARYMNNPRMQLGTSCTISGTGWLVSERIVRAMHGWDFHHLTEDHQFSAFCCANGIRIGYAPAEFFDEQPTTFAASWTQRLRWCKGFYQVLFSYAGELLGGIAKMRWAAYDELVNLGPAAILTVVSVFANGIFLLLGILSRGFLATSAELAMCGGAILTTIVSTYVMFFIMGLLTLLTEHEHIHCNDLRKLVKCALVFPLFMLTYIPINVVALFRRVDWVPTKHTMSLTLEQIAAAGDGPAGGPTDGGDAPAGAPDVA